jgi:hypothetical protein
MKIKIDSDVLANSIKSLQRLVQAQTVSVEVKKGEFNVTGTGNGNSCKMSVPCTIEDKKGTASFSIDANVLLGAINKRKEVELTISDSAVVVKAQRYEAELLVHQFEAIEVVPKDVRESDGLKLKDKFMAALRDNLPKLELKPLLAMYDHTLFGLKATKEGTFIACWDTFQSAFYNDPELKGKVEFTMPGNVFAMIAREIKDQDYQMSVSDTAIYAFNDMFELAIARPQDEDKNQPGLDNVISLYEDLKGRKKDFTRIQIKTEGIKALLENGKGIYEKDATFSFKVSGNKCQLLLKSSFGQVKGGVLLDEKADKDIEFTCDFQFFASLLEKAPATLDLRVSKEVILFNNKPVTYLLSLV